MSNATTDAMVTSINGTVIGTMNEDMFGAIGVNQFGWHHFEDHVEELGLTNIRWPGGTVAETGWVVDGRVRVDGGEISLSTLSGDRSNFAYDLTHPELMSPLALEYDEENFLNRDDVGTFSQVLARAVANDASLQMVIPIKRYFLNEDFSDPSVREEAITAAVSDVSVFLERLKNGEYNNGEYPEKIIFDLGNENYSNPIEQAILSRAISDIITEQLEGSGISYEIAFQMGRGEFEFRNLLEDGYFEPFFDGDFSLVPGLEELGFDPTEGVPTEQRHLVIDEMMQLILGDSIVHLNDVRHHLLQFSEDDLDGENSPLWERAEIVQSWMDRLEEYGVDTTEIDYNLSAVTTNSSNGTDLPYELSAAANILELYDHMFDMGVDAASWWGVVGAFRYNDTMLTTTISDRLSNFDSPQAALLKLLTENVMEADYLGDGGGDAEGYRSFTYETDSEYHIFFYVEDVDQGEFTVDVDLGILSDLHTVTATNLDIVNGAMNGASQLTETEIQVTDGVAQISFDQDFEIVMVSLEKDDSPNHQTMELIASLVQAEVSMADNSETIFGAETAEEIVGGEGSDFIFGMAGDDHLDGGSGRSGFLTSGTNGANFDAVGGNQGDFLFGGEGNDVIRGNAGNDLISGDAGNDELWGGTGFDTFVFSEGQDVIRDFNSSVDSILIDAMLIGQDQELDDWLGENTTTEEGSLVIDFGAGNELTIHGVTDTSELTNSIELSYADLSGF